MSMKMHTWDIAIMFSRMIEEFQLCESSIMKDKLELVMGLFV